MNEQEFNKCGDLTH